MIESQPDSREMPPLSPLLESELAVLGTEGADRLLNIIRGLFHCIGDLNKRVGELETRLQP